MLVDITPSAQKNNNVVIFGPLSIYDWRVLKKLLSSTSTRLLTGWKRVIASSICGLISRPDLPGSWIRLDLYLAMKQVPFHWRIEMRWGLCIFYTAYDSYIRKTATIVLWTAMLLRMWQGSPSEGPVTARTAFKFLCACAFTILMLCLLSGHHLCQYFGQVFCHITTSDEKQYAIRNITLYGFLDSTYCTVGYVHLWYFDYYYMQGISARGAQTSEQGFEMSK